MADKKGELPYLGIIINYDKDKPSVDTKLAVNIDKIKRMFNWSPDITLETGIKNTLKWYRENKV